MPSLASQQQFKAFDVEVRAAEGHIGASVSLISLYSTTHHPRSFLSPVVSKRATRRKGACTGDLPSMAIGSWSQSRSRMRRQGEASVVPS